MTLYDRDPPSPQSPFGVARFLLILDRPERFERVSEREGFRGFQRFLEVFQMFSEFLRRFQRFFRAPLRVPFPLRVAGPVAPNHVAP